MSDWTRTALGELVDMRKGVKVEVFDKHRDAAAPYLGAGSLEAGRSRQWASTRGAVLAQRTDVLMLWDGERSGLTGGGLEGVVASTVSRLRPRGTVDPAFLRHALQAKFPWIQARRTGTGVPHVPKDLGKWLTIDHPESIAEQRSIAELMNALDDEIRLTADVISKLVLAGHGLLETLLSHGVDPTGALRSLGSFASRRGDSGAFPASWSVVQLDQIADVDRGKFGHRPRNDPMYLTGLFPFIQTGDIAAADGGVIVNTSQSLSRLGAAVSREFAAGTIAVTIAANIADTAMLGRPMYFPDSVVGVSVRQPHRTEYVQFVLRAAKPRLEARAPQSAQRNINLQDLRPLEVPLPDPAEQSRICQVMAAHANAVAVERDTLAKLLMRKTALLDVLLSGRVRVPDEANS